MSIRKSVSAIIVAASLLAASFGAHAQDTKVRFVLDWLFQGPSAFFLLTHGKGYFKEEGLDVTIDAGNGATGTLNRVASGAYDMGLADVSAWIEFLAANEQSNPAARLQGVLLLYDAAPNTVVTLKKTGIAKPKDLEGRSVGGPIFDAGRKTFPLFAKAQGLDLAKIKWVTMEPSLRETMLVRGEVDAITGFLFSNYFSLLQRGAKEEDIVSFLYSKYGATLYGSTIVANPKFLAENPEAIRKFNRALLRGVRDVIANPAEGIKYVKARDPLIDADIETRRLKMAIDIVMDTPNVRSNGVGAVNKLRLEENVAAVVSALDLKRSPNVDNMFNSSFLPSAADRKVFVK